MKDRTVYSIGLGPGDPELLTLKAVKILREADLVFVPQSDPEGRSHARDIVRQFVPEDRIRMCYIPMTNQKEVLSKVYDEHASAIAEAVDSGLRVCYVCMGDPTIFSTSNYLNQRLTRMGYRVVHVPGISSINAASSHLGLALTVKGQNFGVYEMPGDVEIACEYIKRHDTVVFLKVHKRLDILQEAVNRTSPERAFLLRRIGLEGETVLDITTNGKGPLPSDYLSIAIIKRGR